MDRARLEACSTFLVSLLDGLQDTLAACAAQKKQCPMTCSQRRGFIEAANAVVSVMQQIIEEEDEAAKSTGKLGASTSSASVDHPDTSSIAVLGRQLAQVRTDGDLLHQFIVRYHPDTTLEPGTSPTVTTSRVADLLKVKQTFRSLEINLHDVEQLLRIVYSRVFETPTTSPNASVRILSSHDSETTALPHETGTAASRYAFINSDDEDEDGGAHRWKTAAAGAGPKTAATTTPSTATMSQRPPSGGSSTAATSPPLQSRTQTEPYGVVVGVLPPVAVAINLDRDPAATAPDGRRTQKMSSSEHIGAPHAQSPLDNDSDDGGGSLDDDEPDARPVEAILSGGSGPPPHRASTGTLPYMRGSRSQAMASLSVDRSDMGEDSLDGDFSGPRVGTPRGDSDDEMLSSIKPRATAVLFPGAPHARAMEAATPSASASKSGDGARPGAPPLHPGGAAGGNRGGSSSSSSGPGAVPAVTAPPSLERKKGARLVTTQHSHRMPGELWVSLRQEIPDEVEACFIEDVLSALNAPASDQAAPLLPVVADDQVLNVQLMSLDQFLYVRFAVEHDRQAYPKKEIDARVAAYSYPMLSQLYEEAFHAQRAREEAELDRLDSGDDLFSEVVSSSRSRRGSASQHRRDSVHSINSALLTHGDGSGESPVLPSSDGPNVIAGNTSPGPGALRLAVPTSVTASSASGGAASPLDKPSQSTSLTSVSKTASASALPRAEQARAGSRSGTDAGSYGSFPAVEVSGSLSSAAETAGEYRVKLPGKHWPTVLFFVSKPMMRPVAVEEVALATGVALKAVTDVKLSIGSLCIDFVLDRDAADDPLSATDAPAVWPSCSEFAIRALESHDFALIHEQYIGACRDLFLENDLADRTALYAEEVLGPSDPRPSREGSTRRSAATATAAAGAAAPVSFFTLPAVEELDKSASSLPGSKVRQSGRVTAPSQTNRASLPNSAVRTTSMPSYSYASSLGGRPDTPDNEPITLLHLALENDLTVTQLRSYNPQLDAYDDDAPLPDELAVIRVPRPTWLYEEGLAEESIASSSGTPVRPPVTTAGGGGTAAHEPSITFDVDARAGSPVMPPPSSSSPVGPLSTGAGQRRFSVHSHTASAPTAAAGVGAASRLDSVSSVASSTLSTSSSATARLRKRQKLLYVDPALGPKQEAVVTSAPTHQDSSPEAAAAATSSSPPSSPPARAPMNKAPPPSATTAAPAPAPAVPVIPRVVAAYPHLTTPGSGTTPHPTLTVAAANPATEAEATTPSVPAAVAEPKAESKIVKKTRPGMTAATTDTAAATQTAPVAAPAPVATHSPPPEAPSQQPVVPRLGLPAPVPRPRPVVGAAASPQPASSALFSPRGVTRPDGEIAGNGNPTSAVPQRAHPNAPPPLTSSYTAPAPRGRGRVAGLSPRATAITTTGPSSAHVLPSPTTVTAPGVVPSAASASALALAPTTANVVVPTDGHPKLGFRLDKNLILASVRPGSAAEQSGMTAGTQIRTINGKPVHTAEDFQRLLRHAASQSLPSVLLITTSRPSAEAQGAAWSAADESEDSVTGAETAARPSPAPRDVRTHWIRLVSGAVPAQASSDPDAAPQPLISPRGRHADRPPAAPKDATTTTTTTAARAAAYQRVRSHSSNPFTVGAADEPTANSQQPPPHRSSLGHARRSSSGTARRHTAPHGQRTPSSGRRLQRQESLDETDVPAPRSAVPMPTPMAATGSAPEASTCGKIRVRSRSARKPPQDA